MASHFVHAYDVNEGDTIMCEDGYARIVSVVCKYSDRVLILPDGVSSFECNPDDEIEIMEK